MSHGVWLGIVLLALTAAPTGSYADEVLHGYEGDVLPTDAGWSMGGTCDGPCMASVDEANGYFVLHWPYGGELVNYFFLISNDFNEPPQPPSLWVEWRFRSDQLFTVFPGCDAGFSIRYQTISDRVGMFGDLVHSAGGDFGVSGLDPSRFHTYRFESFDGISFTFAVDGLPFWTGVGRQSVTNAFLFFRGGGNCGLEDEPNTNEWDYVRYGTLATDAVSLVATDPPAGRVNPTRFPNLDRFTVTFDAPHYIYLDEIDVSVTGAGDPPLPDKTWRLQNGAPETLEIVLDRPMPLDEITTITIDDGAAVHVLEFDRTIVAPCCFGDGACAEIPETDCVAQGGTPLDISLLCEGDQDNDGIDGTCGDDCPLDPDNDIDGDGLCGDVDPCPFEVTGDSDGDGLCDGVDPCPFDPDNDIDGDGVCGDVDPCPLDRFDDSDGDGVCDSEDQCPGVDDTLFAPECATAIPATSTWGLVVLTLLLLIAAKSCFSPFFSAKAPRRKARP